MKRTSKSTRVLTPEQAAKTFAAFAAAGYPVAKFTEALYPRSSASKSALENEPNGRAGTDQD